VTAAAPLARAKDNGGGYAAADLLVPAQATGPPLRPQGCCASRCARRPCGPPLTPETSATPRPGNAGRPSLPRPPRGHQQISRATQDHHNRSLHG
jgi:hypothetical protein